MDIRQQRSLIVKSRGHFRALATSSFDDAQIIEVDVPCPHHASVRWK